MNQKKIHSIKMLAILLVAGFFSGCSEGNMELPQNGQSYSGKQSERHRITIIEALGSLDEFVNDGKKTRAASKKIRNVLTLSYNSIRTRGEAGKSIDCENLVYVANFENNEGYAILAADDRIGDDVLAVTESGNISNSTLYRTASQGGEDEDSEDRPVFDGYPTEGPGFYYLDEYPGEIFMNPNTVNLYIESENDTLVGDFDETTNTTNIETRSEQNLKTGRSNEYVLSLILSYASSNVMGYTEPMNSPGNGNEPSGPNGEDDDTEHDDNGDDPDPGADIGGGNGGIGMHFPQYGEWKTIKEISPFLGFASDWHQGFPFNRYYPTRRAGFIFGHEKTAPAGCFPLAVAKLFVYHNVPARFNYCSDSFEIRNFKNYRSLWNDTQQIQISTFLKGISDYCKAWYFYYGTFCFPGSVKRYLKNSGYRNVKKVKYNENKIISMLDKRFPIIIYGMPSIHITRSHAWIIDGYKLKSRSVRKSGIESEESKYWIHCDFGWSGDSNGFYVSKIFNNSDQNIEFDGYHTQKFKYNRHIRIITYDSVGK